MCTPPEPADDTAAWVAIVLAGGGSERLGIDKTQVCIDGVPALDRVLDAVRAVAGVRTPAAAVLCVGAERGTRAPVTWVREDPPGAGPAAGVAAAVRVLGESHPSAALAVVLAGDLPMLSASVVDRLLAAVPPPGQADGARLTDPGGRPQHLLGAYGVDALRRSIEQWPDWSGASMRRLLAPLSLVDVPARGAESLDLDTVEDVEAAQRLLSAGTPVGPAEEET